MTNLLDLKYLRQVAKRVREMAEDPNQAERLISELDRNPELREELSHLYVIAKRTLERAKSK